MLIGLGPGQPQPQPQRQQQSPLVVETKLSFLTQIGTFAAQVYQANWRNFVIAIAAVNAFRFIVSSSQRPTLIRVYVYLAFLAALLIITAGFITGIQYFLLAEDIITECVALAVSGSWISKSVFRGKLRPGQLPTAQVAQEQCRLSWSHGSTSQVFGIFVFSVLPAIIFFLLAYTYYRQTTDPSHSACLNLKNGEAVYVRMEAYPNPSPIYNGTRNGNSNRAAPLPAGSQPLRARTPRVQPIRAVPSLQLSPTMRTAGESPYGVSPGPPSYAPPRATHGYGHVWFGVADDRR
ncbi:hypothetical protein H0H87_006781 [Tephrocybe sp. NHM501043]|nr:hypothetical protein H0H87_006781 [Tephrocybe sp. NHM501043]